MNAIIKTLAPATEIFPLADLFLSTLNPRQEHDAEGIALLADSLATCGLMQNLGGLRNEDGRIGIVYGGRRLAALRLAAERRPDLAFVPVRIAPDAETALAWATAENTAREALHPADEIRAYGRMADTGAGIPAIAAAFAVTEAHVRRRLKLATLPEPVLDALRAGEISYGHATLFTLCNDEDRALSVLNELRGREMSEHGLRQLLQSGSIRPTDRRVRFVTLEAYEAAGGGVTRDLFSQDVFAEDAALLDDLFAAKLDDAAQAAQAGGWKWAKVCTESHVGYQEMEEHDLSRLYPVEGELTEAEAEEYDRLAEDAEAETLDDAGVIRLAELDTIIEGSFTDGQRALAGVMVYVNHRGELCPVEGLVLPEDKPAAIEAGFLRGSAHAAHDTDEEGETPDAPKSPYSGALVQDMKAIRLAAVQTALLAKPELVLDLLAFGLSLASGVSTTVFDLSPGRPTNQPTKTDGLDRDVRLDHSPASHEAWNRPELRVDDLAEAFRSFTAKGKKTRNAAITEGIARTLPYGAGSGDFFTLIEADSGASIRKVWTPTAENFFNRVSGGYLDDLFSDLLDLSGTDLRLKGFRAKKKAEKAASMERLFCEAEYQAVHGVTADQKARIDAWVPDCL